MKPRCLRRKPRRQRRKQWKQKKQRRSQEWGRGRERGRRIREPWRRVMRWTSSAARSGNQIPRWSATRGKRSGSTRKFVAETMTKKAFFERGSATLRKPRFDPIYYPDRKREEERINVPVKWTELALLCKWSLSLCCNVPTRNGNDTQVYFVPRWSLGDTLLYILLPNLYSTRGTLHDVDAYYWFKFSPTIHWGGVWVLSHLGCFSPHFILCYSCVSLTHFKLFLLQCLMILFNLM